MTRFVAIGRVSWALYTPRMRLPPELECKRILVSSEP